MPNSELPLVLTAKETAKFLRIGKSTFYEQIRCGRIGYLRIGRRILVPRTALLKMLELEGEDNGTHSLPKS